jgi:GH18 family chitinase
MRDSIQVYADDFKIASEFNVKILLSVGEFHGNTMQTDNFGKIAANEQSRASFAERMAEFIFKHNLGGIVVNWLAPGCIKVILENCSSHLFFVGIFWEQLQCAGGSSTDKINYPKLLQELRRVLKPDMEIIITLPYSRDWWIGDEEQK